MSELLPFVVSGIATGAIYGLIAAGLTLTYKTSGILNFGQGALATAGAYLFYFLHYDKGMAWLPAMFIAVFCAGPLMGFLMERLSRQLSIQRTEWKIVGTVGLIVLMEGIGFIAYGTDTIDVPQYLPNATGVFRVGGVNIQYAQLWVTLIGILVVAALYFLFRKSRAGIAMRAVVDDPDLVSMQGSSARRIRRSSWMIGSTLAALSGVLILPFIGLSGTGLTLLAIVTFGAAAIGMFSSIPITFLGGVAIGIAAGVATKYSINASWLSGLPNTVPVIVLIVALLFIPSWRLRPVSAVEVRLRLQWHAPARVRLVGAVILLALLVAVPQVVDASKLGFYTNGLAEMILLFSLGILVKNSGQVSLCQAAFAAVGAVTFSQLAVDHGWPWFPAFMVSCAVAVPLGILVAMPAVRLSGVFFALSTLGFGVMLAELFYSQGFMFTLSAAGRPVPRPAFASTDKQYYYLVLAIVALVAVTMLVIDRSRLGRMLRGLSQTPVGMVSMGLSIVKTRLIVFSVSAFMAAMAGILYSGSVHYATAADPNFGFFYSLTLLALVALAPGNVPWYAVFGLVATVIPGYLTSPNVANWFLVLFGVGAITNAIQGGPPALAPRLRDLLERIGGRQRRHVGSDELAVPVVADADHVMATTNSTSTGQVVGRDTGPVVVGAQHQGSGLEVKDLVVYFGGLAAVNHVSFKAPAGRITGIIGPNGAGKTTAFDACSGLNRRISGSVLLDGQEMTRKSPAARARSGLGRTFQIMQLGDSLTVLENVSLGHEASLAGGRVRSQLAARSRDVRATREAALAAMEQCGITHLAEIQAGTLSTGQRRLVEVARSSRGFIRDPVARRTLVGT